MRIFLAIDLPDTIKNKITELEERLKPFAKYMKLSPPENLHITVKFLGEQNDFSIDKIKELTRESLKKIDSFDVNMKRSGIFGSINNPRILWIGADSKDFENMALILHKELNIFRYEDKRPLCHLTIGRIKKIPKADIIDAMNECRNFVLKNNLRFGVSNVYLYKSNLLKSGAVYEKIDKFNMKEK